MPADVIRPDAVDVSMIDVSLFLSESESPTSPLVSLHGRRKASRLDLSALQRSASVSDTVGDWTFFADNAKATFDSLPFDIHQAIAKSCGPQWACLLAQANQQMRQVVLEAKRSGEMNTSPVAVGDVLEWCRGSRERLAVAWNQGFPRVHGRKFAAQAAEAGDTELLMRARRDGCPLDWRACRAAAAGGHLEALQFLRENGCTWDYRTYEVAAQQGHSKLLEWAKEHGLPSSRGCITL